MQYLKDVPKDKAFILGHKRIVNLLELLSEFKLINDEEYSHYVSKNHNYFADWILHVVDYEDLAKELKNTKNRTDAINVLEYRLKNTKPEKKNETNKLKKTDQKVESQKQNTIEKKDNLTPKPSSKKNLSKDEVSKILEKIENDEVEIKHLLWKHYSWDLAKEFMYGLAIGILMGFVLSRIFLP